MRVLMSRELSSSSEVPDVATAKAYTDDFPLSKAGFLEWFFIALQVPLPLETLFRDGVDSMLPSR
jgi:hypothetical protein